MRASRFTASISTILTGILICTILLPGCDTTVGEKGGTGCDTAAIIRDYRGKLRARFKALLHDSDSPIYKLSPEDPDSIFDIVFPWESDVIDFEPVDSITYESTLQISEKNIIHTPIISTAFQIGNILSDGTPWGPGDYIDIEIPGGIDVAVFTNSSARPFRDLQDDELDAVRRHKILGLTGVFTSDVPLRSDSPSYADTIKLIHPGTYRIIARNFPPEEIRWEVDLAP